MQDRNPAHAGRRRRARRPAIAATALLAAGATAALLTLTAFLPAGDGGSSAATRAGAAPSAVDVTPAGAATTALAPSAVDIAPAGAATIGATSSAIATPPVSTSVRDSELEPSRRATAATDPHRFRPAPFDVRVDGQPVPYVVGALAVLPGAHVRLEAGGTPTAAAFLLRYAAGAVGDAGMVGDAGSPGTPGGADATAAANAPAPAASWRWTAPREPGIYALEIRRADSYEVVRLNALVLHPSSHVENGALHGFRIGSYVAKPLNGRDVYLPPVGFVEVAPGDETVLVSPHFALGQFLSKQAGTPRFVAFSDALVLKLEAILEAVNEAGIGTGTFHVMSGFRTPWYNRSIGNTTVYSRHLWGDAADIFVDTDGDGDMDDLNRDGRVDLADAHFLAAIVDRVESGGLDTVLPGGVGTYRRNAAHGPFVHVDARGYAARW
jgi:hypothetical protein